MLRSNIRMVASLGKSSFSQRCVATTSALRSNNIHLSKVLPLRDLFEKILCPANAGVKGFEPLYDGIKNRRRTTWLYSTCSEATRDL